MILNFFGPMSTSLSGANAKVMLGPREVPAVSTYTYILPPIAIGTPPTGVGNKFSLFGPREHPATSYTYSGLPAGVLPASLPSVIGRRFVDLGYVRPPQELPAGVPVYVS